VKRAAKSFGRNAGQRFLAGHPMAARNTPAWSLPMPISSRALPGSLRRFLARTSTPASAENSSTARRRWAQKSRSSIRRTRPHLRLDQPSAADDLHRPRRHAGRRIRPRRAVLDIGGRALREMTRISGSPYSMWRDIAITNKKNLADALHKLEQRLATSAKIWTRSNWRTNSSAPTS